MSEKFEAVSRPPGPDQIELLSAAARWVIDAYKAGRFSQAEMHQRFWRCINQIPPGPPPPGSCRSDSGSLNSAEVAVEQDQQATRDR